MKSLDITIAEEVFGWTFHSTKPRDQFGAQRVLAPDQEYLDKNMDRIPSGIPINFAQFVPEWSSSVERAIELAIYVELDIKVCDLPGSPEDLAALCLQHFRTRIKSLLPVFTKTWTDLSARELQELAMQADLRDAQGRVIMTADNHDRRSEFFRHIALTLAPDAFSQNYEDGSPEAARVELVRASIRQSRLAKFHDLSTDEEE